MSAPSRAASRARRCEAARRAASARSGGRRPRGRRRSPRARAGAGRARRGRRRSPGEVVARAAARRRAGRRCRARGDVDRLRDRKPDRSWSRSALSGRRLEGAQLRPVAQRAPDRDRRRLAKAADRGQRHRLQPFLALLRANTAHRRRPKVERAVADPARGALLARLLGEEAHRLGEQAERGVGAGEDLDSRRADPAAPSASASRVSGVSSAAGGRIPLAAPPGTIALGSAAGHPRSRRSARAR